MAINKQDADSINKLYAPLWKLMDNEHACTLTITEMDDVINAALEVLKLKKQYDFDNQVKQK
jgi:hypothetical protein